MAVSQELHNEILAELDRLDREAMEPWASHQQQQSIGLFVESQELKRARAAFGDMTYEKFVELKRQNALPPKGQRKRGPKKHDPLVRAEEPMFRAAHDYDRIREIWPKVASNDAFEIAAQRHGVDVEELRVKWGRGESRRYDKLARR